MYKILSAIPRKFSEGSTSYHLSTKEESTERTLSSCCLLRLPSRILLAIAEMLSIFVPHHTTIDGSFSKILNSSSCPGSLEQRLTIAEASQKFTSFPRALL